MTVRLHPHAVQRLGERGATEGRSGMKLAYDPRYNIAYLRLEEHSTEVETVHVSDQLNVDLTPDGRIYGIELLNANEQLSGLARGKLIVQNEATGETIEVRLP